MIIIECACINRIHAQLVISNQRCYVQQIKNDTAVLNEYKIPIYYDDGSPIDIEIEIDDTIIKYISTYKTVKIYKSFMDFGNIVYLFNKTNKVLTTKLPSFRCICDLPYTYNSSDEKVILEVSDEMLKIKFDNVCITVATLYCSNIFQTIIINGSYLPCGLCKIYFDEDTPLCIETSEKFMYIAPLFDEQANVY